MLFFKLMPPNILNMAARYPETSFGTRTQIRLCNRYFEIMENGRDPDELESAYNLIMSNDCAERGVGIMTNGHMISEVKEAHEAYLTERNGQPAPA